MRKKINLDFHETFQPEFPYISKILGLAIAEYRGNKFDISSITGIPTGKEKGKVEPHIKYAKLMGLIDYSYEKGTYRLTATDVGSEVRRQDKYLHEILTAWLCHYCISRPKLGAPQWTYIVRHANMGFTSDISPEFVYSGAQRELECKSILDTRKAFSVVKGSYTGGCFMSMDYLRWDEIISFVEKSEQIELMFLYAFALLDSWNILYPDNNEITFPEVMEKIAFGKIFGLNDEDTDLVLCSLEEKGIVKINRQLFPITVVKTASKKEIIPRLYNMLM